MSREVPTGREAWIEAISDFLAVDRGPELAAVRRVVGGVLDSAGPEALAALNGRLDEPDDDREYHPADPLARRIHLVLSERFLDRGSVLRGLEHLHACADAPLILVANHLSYSDANVLDVLLRRAGCGAIADRLTAVAGPKVYSSRTRRFSSLCFGTIKTAQSLDRSSEEAVMQARDVARMARQAIDIAHARLRAGDALLLFPEGSRSRTGAMQALLPAVARYLEFDQAQIVPVGITGSEGLFPIDATTVHRVTATATVGPAFDMPSLRARVGRDRRAQMDFVGRAIAALLPIDYRGVYR